jgi:hypothetical protein
MAFMALGGLAAGAGAVGGLGGLGTALSVIGTGVGLMGSFAQAQGTIAAGKAAQRQHEMQAMNSRFQAEQLEARGKWERAQHRQKADLAKQKKVAAISRAQAIGASSGFLADDHTSSLNIANLERWGSFDEFNELAGGEAAQRDNQIADSSKRFEAGYQDYAGTAAMASAKSRASSTILGGVGSAFSSLSKIKTSATAYG